MGNMSETYDVNFRICCMYMTYHILYTRCAKNFNLCAKLSLLLCPITYTVWWICQYSDVDWRPSHCWYIIFVHGMEVYAYNFSIDWPCSAEELANIAATRKTMFLQSKQTCRTTEQQYPPDRVPKRTHTIASLIKHHLKVNSWCRMAASKFGFMLG